MLRGQWARSNIPGLKGLIGRIQKKRLQDDQVVSGIVATHILFTLLYFFAQGGGVGGFGT